MTDPAVEALTDALRDVERVWTNRSQGTPLYRDEPGIVAQAVSESLSEHGLSIVPTEQAAIGAAVERLPDDRGWSITKNPGDDYLVEFAAPDHEIEPAAFAPTLPEAIEAALGEAEP